MHSRLILYRESSVFVWDKVGIFVRLLDILLANHIAFYAHTLRQNLRGRKRGCRLRNPASLFLSHSFFCLRSRASLLVHPSARRKQSLGQANDSWWNIRPMPPRLLARARPSSNTLPISARLTCVRRIPFTAITGLLASTHNWSRPVNTISCVSKKRYAFCIFFTLNFPNT